MTQSRRMLVLRAIVEDYIRSQEPIGSSALTRTHDLGVSAATVRNDMAALEDEGYLIQPHTSAGRIPTEKGYRYFVDRLATVVPMSGAQRRGIAAFLSGSTNLQDTLRRAARLLSQITGQVAVVASPALSKATLRHVEIVPVGTAVLLAVVITDTGQVGQHTLAAGRMPRPDELARFGAAVNAECSGHSLAHAAERVRAIALWPSHHGFAALAEALAGAFERMADADKASELYMAGTSKLAHRQAAADLAPLFDALEEQVVLMRLMSSMAEGAQIDGVGVAIGSETHTPGLLHASVVSGGYGHAPAAETHGAAQQGEAGPADGAGGGTDDATQPGRAASAGTADEARGEPDDEPDGTQPEGGAAGQPIAFVGSIGPTHMDYAATIAAVRAVARYLTISLAPDSGQGEA